MAYAEIKDGVCVNTVEADEAFARFMNLVELPDGYGIGDYYTGGIWSHEAPEPEPTHEEAVTWSSMATSIKEGVNEV